MQVNGSWLNAEFKIPGQNSTNFQKEEVVFYVSVMDYIQM